jgi:hypothetical protein
MPQPIGEPTGLHLIYGAVPGRWIWGGMRRCASPAKERRQRWPPLNPADHPAEKVKSFGSDTPMGRAGLFQHHRRRGAADHRRLWRVTTYARTARQPKCRDAYHRAEGPPRFIAGSAWRAGDAANGAGRSPCKSSVKDRRRPSPAKAAHRRSAEPRRCAPPRRAR